MTFVYILLGLLALYVVYRLLVSPGGSSRRRGGGGCGGGLDIDFGSDGDGGCGD